MDESSNRTAIEELSLTECLALLDGRQVGRVAVVVDGQPTILPVNYRADDGTVGPKATLLLSGATSAGQ